MYNQPAIPMTNAVITFIAPISPRYPNTNITNEAINSFQKRLDLTVVTAARIK